MEWCNDEAELYYVEKGNGIPLILLHGNGGNSTYFEKQLEYFSKEYRVIAVDTRGHGQSPRGRAPFTIRQFAEDLKLFMDRMGIEKAHLLGFSDGGNVALCFALKYPERIDKLILNGANLNAKGVKRSVQLPIEIGYCIAKMFANKSAEAGRHAEMLGLMVNEPNIKEEQLKQMTVPTLVIAGTRDMIKESHIRKMYENLPNARLAVIEGDHFIANKRAETFNKEVEDFLR